jgi:hypothetical protein
MTAGSASTQGNEFLISTPPLPPCAPEICGSRLCPVRSLSRRTERRTTDARRTSRARYGRMWVARDPCPPPRLSKPPISLPTPYDARQHIRGSGHPEPGSRVLAESGPPRRRALRAGVSTLRDTVRRRGAMMSSAWMIRSGLMTGAIFSLGALEPLRGQSGPTGRDTVTRDVGAWEAQRASRQPRGDPRRLAPRRHPVTGSRPHATSGAICRSNITRRAPPSMLPAGD